MEKTITFAPRIIRETSRGLECIALQDEMLANREVMAIGEINAELVNALIAQLLYLKKADPDGEVTMYVNSPGGEVTSGLALYDVMQGISCPIRTVCTGLAASMASVLFAAGDMREMLPHSRLMLHDPLTTAVSGSALEVNSRAQDLMRTRQEMAEIYAKHTGKSVEEVFEVTSKDTYFMPEAAVEFGLADRIVKEV